ncbi:MAG: hypothetical protein ACD_35C00180G0001 [uncultured bacterium]|nr:MAG: hypothetical protein ACD_35C00180G0001 [uncultured bacterium]
MKSTCPETGLWRGKVALMANPAKKAPTTSWTPISFAPSAATKSTTITN